MNCGRQRSLSGLLGARLCRTRVPERAVRPARAGLQLQGHLLRNRPSRYNPEMRQAGTGRLRASRDAGLLYARHTPWNPVGAPEAGMGAPPAPHPRQGARCRPALLRERILPRGRSTACERSTSSRCLRGSNVGRFADAVPGWQPPRSSPKIPCLRRFSGSLRASREVRTDRLETCGGRTKTPMDQTFSDQIERPGVHRLVDGVGRRGR